MKKTNQLLFALRNQHWVHISEVPSGGACACECPACSAPLVAKKGQRNRHHFAHLQGFNCSAALETSLHLLGKAIVVKNKRIRTPVLHAYNAKQLRASRQEAFTTAIEEARLGNTQIDVLLQDGRQELGRDKSYAFFRPAENTSPGTT